MSNNTAVAVIPADLQLPAHLQTPDAVAAIAAANAAAAGGIKTGSWPKLSKKGSKFHIIDGDEVQTLMEPPTQPGAPSLPKMLLQVVVAAANPGISKALYLKDFNESDAGHEPDCKSSNGITPDATVAAPQHTNCAQCPQNQWGSKISKMSGKETKACTDMKQLVILPRGDLKFKAVGLALTPSELKDWGAYVKALSGRSIPVNAVWTNLTFDANATHPKLTFSFAGVLTAEEYAQVQERAKGDDVKNIVTPVQAPLALAAPVAQTPPPTQPAAVQEEPKSVAAGTVVPPAPVSVAAPVTNGFGAVAAPSAEPPKRTRSPRKPAPEAQAAAASAAGATATSAATIAAQSVAAAQATNAAALDPYAGLPPHVKVAVEATQAAGGDFKTVYQSLAGKPYSEPVAAQSQPQSTQAEVAPAAAPATAPVVNGFGAAAVAATAAAATASQATAGQSLRDKLAAKLAAAPVTAPVQ